MPTHRCHAEGCPVMVPYHILMCLPHWRQVPAPLKDEVNRTWRAYLRTYPGNDHTATLATIRAHHDAKWRAVAAVKG